MLIRIIRIVSGSIAALICLMLMLSLAACGDTGAPASSATPTTKAENTPSAVPNKPIDEPTEVASDGWMTFSSEADGFSVEMPGEPQTSARSMDSALGELTLHFFQLTDGAEYYAVSYNDYPAEMTTEDLDPESILNDSIEATAQGSKAENVQRVEVQGNPGIEGEINVKETTHIWYRSILANNRLYQLVMAAPEAEKGAFAIKARRFIESFTLFNQ